MNILFVGPYKSLDKHGLNAYNLLGCLNSIKDFNVVARNIQYNNLFRSEIDPWCKVLENKECLEKYDYIFQSTIPSDFVYTPNSIAVTIIEPALLRDSFWERKLAMMPKVIVGSLQEKWAAKYNKNVIVLPTRIDAQIKYKVYDPPKIKELGKSYIFYWVGEYGDTTCYKEVFQAFHLEFNRKENVHLVMRFINQSDQNFIEKLKEELQQLKLSLRKYNNVDFYKEDTIQVGCDLNTIRSYHAYCDCYLDINRGTHNWSILKEAQLFSKQIITNEINANHEPIIGHRVYSPRSLWRSISIKDIQNKMRKCYENRDPPQINIEKLDYSYGGQKIKELLI